MFFTDFREKGREKEKHGCERETSIICFLYSYQPRIKPITSVYALARNQIHNLLVYGMVLQLTEPPSQEPSYFFKYEFKSYKKSGKRKVMRLRDQK